MKCPYCGSLLSRVVDKRAVVGDGQIRRRRECLKCIKRFTTYEKLADTSFLVIKRDGRKEPFSREKLAAGVIKALEKRPAFTEASELVDRLERKLRRKGLLEISSKTIGTLVLTELKKIDPVAYIRFCSVYRNFDSGLDFAKELEHLS